MVKIITSDAIKDYAVRCEHTEKQKPYRLSAQMARPHATKEVRNNPRNIAS